MSVNFSSITFYSILTAVICWKIEIKTKQNEKKKTNKKLFKTPNPQTYLQLLRTSSQVILPRFSLLFLVCDADLLFYRMLLTGGSFLCIHGKMHVIVPPHTPEEPSDLQPLCSLLLREMAICPAQAARSQFPLIFCICTTFLLKTLNKLIKQTLKGFSVSLQEDLIISGESKTFLVEHKAWGRGYVIVRVY